jgi:hypothetical protein
MPNPIELCLEDLDAAEGTPEYLQCVAREGGEPGLAVDEGGRILWEDGASAAFDLWVSQDEKLMLERRERAAEVVVSRGGRSLSAPCGKPVILRDQDFVTIASRRYRIHVHGLAAEVHPPAPLFRKALAALAAAAALGSAACTTAQADPPKGADAGEIQVRPHPPKVAAPRPPPEPVRPDGGTPSTRLVK